MILALTIVLTALFCCNISTVFAATSGTCGNNANWSYNTSTKVLTISGTGAMSDYNTYSGLAGNSAPWADYKTKAGQAIETVIVEEGITTVGSSAFYGCSNLKTVSLPNSLLEIRGEKVAIGSVSSKGAFEECPLLDTINFPSKLVNIGINAFQKCISLSNVLFPSTIKTIDKNAFNGCTSIVRITLPDSLTTLGRNAFDGCTALETVNFGTGLTAVTEYAFQNSGVKNIKFSSSITSIAQYAFYGCKMSRLELPDTIESIGMRAFANASFLAEVIINNPNCTFNGVLKQDPFNGSAVKPLTFYGHSGSTTQTFVEAHASDGYVFVALGDCNHTDTREEITVAPTCTEKGLMTVICNACGFEVSKSELPATGHTFEVTQRNDASATDGHIYTTSACSACGETKNEIEHVNYIEGYYDYTNTATCTKTGLETYTCTVEGCGKKKVAVAPKGNHQFDNMTVTKAATCTEDGTQEGVCTVCNETITQKIPATGHSNEQTGSLDSTATDGHTYELYKCSVCGAETAVPTHVAWVEGNYTSKVITNPGCVLSGTQSNTCTICNKVEIVQIPATGQHVWVETGRTAPTCTAKGKIDYACENCNLTKYENIDALGHDYVLQEGDSTYPATCTTAGNNYYKCSRCSSSKSERIEPLGHTADETNYTVLNEPDCENTGLASSVCTVCGVSFEITLETLGHNYENVIVPIQNEPGHSMSTPTCTRCSKTTTASKVHDAWIEGQYTNKVVTEVSCTVPGTSVDTCNICNITRTNTIPATGHKYHFSGMDERNRFTYTCEVCAHISARTPASLLLSWNTSYINTAPEETEYGYLFEVTGDSFINARDYGEIVRARNSSGGETTEPSTEVTNQN